jgi:UDP-N-acetylglucosamine transferase subunit ALG13
MVFVTLGTQRLPFDRLLREVENLIKTLDIKDEFIVQAGYTRHKSELFQSFDFVGNSRFETYMDCADIIITHAGSGALFTAIKKRKKIIAVARLKKYGEMLDDHQAELLKKLSEEGYIIDGSGSLVEAWRRLENFAPRGNDFHNMEILRLKTCIDSFM